jgi:hypothetical protein
MPNFSTGGPFLLSKTHFETSCYADFFMQDATVEKNLNLMMRFRCESLQVNRLAATANFDLPHPHP